MSDIVERLRRVAQAEREVAMDADMRPEDTINAEYAKTCDEAADTITALRADNERLRTYALKAFTVVEFCCGEGLLLPFPFYDCDDLLCEGVELLNVETTEEARAALGEQP